ncbi:MAG: FKBP-type peptidyl-prolyl cis-trans isomerase [Verrucomicrobia bacterium]|nr:FKBP-type peptidyl-prolyl cis-trans isomerase [Verrucomicrobiota bacterium]
MRLRVSRLALVCLVLLSAPLVRAQREKFPEDDLEFIEKTWPNAQKDNMGIRYLVEKPGHGPLPVPGNLVSVLYRGQLLDGTVFDESLDRNRPFTFRVGRELVIQGWDFVIQQMRLGEKRIVIIPAELGYGTRGSPPRIPRNATLVFEMELIDIKRD